MPLKVTWMPYLSISYLQPFQNWGRSNFWGGCKTCTSQRGTIKFCILIDLQRMNNETSFVQNKKCEHGGRLNVKIHSLFCGDNSWTVVLRQMNFGIEEIMDIHISFIWIIVLFDALFKYGVGAKFWGYVGINAEPLCVELCNFVQYHIFVNYLTIYLSP
jgi:hypothetical protein